MEDCGEKEGLSIQCSLSDEKEARKVRKWKLLISQ
jgi:hypothetical protein